MDLLHEVIPVGLGQDACSSYGKVFSVTLHDGGVRDVLVLMEAVAVYQQMLGPHFQSIHSTVHGQNGCGQDINFIYLRIGHDPDGPGKRLPFYNRAKRIALLLRKLFRVIEQFISEIRGQYHRSGKHGACQRASAGLVTARLEPSRLHIWFQYTLHSSVVQS